MRQTEILEFMGYYLTYGDQAYIVDIKYLITKIGRFISK